MLDIFTVSFFGHRRIYDLCYVESCLEQIIRKLIDEKEYVDFLVGRNGEFDICAASSVVRVRKKHRNDNSSLVLVLAYESADLRNNKEYYESYYNEIEISYKASIANPKAAISIRNREMIDRSDLVICHVKENHGGAYQALKYAEKQKKTVINIADRMIRIKNIVRQKSVDTMIQHVIFYHFSPFHKMV